MGQVYFVQSNTQIVLAIGPIHMEVPFSVLLLGECLPFPRSLCVLPALLTGSKGFPYSVHPPGILFPHGSEHARKKKMAFP